MIRLMVAAAIGTLLLLSGCSNDYPNDWSDFQCENAYAAALMNGPGQSDRLVKWEIHCCTHEAKNIEDEGCRPSLNGD